MEDDDDIYDNLLKQGFLKREKDIEKEKHLKKEFKQEVSPNVCMKTINKIQFLKRIVEQKSLEGFFSVLKNLKKKDQVIFFLL